MAAARGRAIAISHLDVSGRPRTVSVAYKDVSNAVDFLDTIGSTITAIDPVENVRVADSRTVEAPDDPLLGNQWAFQNHSYMDAWECGTGDGVTVAVLDSGVIIDHEDLVGRVEPGADFSASPYTAAPYAGGDEYGHGTKVAGVIAASANNGVGIAGVAPDAEILAVKVLRNDGNGTSTSVANGIVWAADNGAQIINLSLVIIAKNEPANVSMAVSYARSKGVLVIAAAGNTGKEETGMWPAGNEGVIAVGAHDQSRQVAWFSTHGSFLDVSAPGYFIETTDNTGGYTSVSGTSFATPHVAGVAALMLGAGLGEESVRGILRSTADDAGPVGFDHGFGYGIVNPRRAVS